MKLYKNIFSNILRLKEDIVVFVYINIGLNAVSLYPFQIKSGMLNGIKRMKQVVKDTWRN